MEDVTLTKNLGVSLTVKFVLQSAEIGKFLQTKNMTQIKEFEGALNATNCQAQSKLKLKLAATSS